ncbi:hypothetical protein [Arthrobacter sp. PsM3]|uniref:hypothetical protein n=1 Tax=Arthrobacter sp. PsM3 TaxID=3030531 RepID=UPI00263BCEB9|nr:hypothetical protein [Arthrobacter sp. PsM3]MDN4643909.1 hypothetical protein [Arthrobacter sp. PsM3]
MTGRDATGDCPGRMPPEVEALILEAVELIQELDDTGLHEMTPLFYQHGYEQLRISLGDLLTVLGHDPDLTPQE